MLNTFRMSNFGTTLISDTTKIDRIKLFEEFMNVCFSQIILPGK